MPSIETCPLYFPGPLQFTLTLTTVSHSHPCVPGPITTTPLGFSKSALVRPRYPKPCLPLPSRRSIQKFTCPSCPGRRRHAYSTKYPSCITIADDGTYRSRQFLCTMPRYTQARLAYALEVFRDSLPYRAKRGFKTDHLEQHLKKYELRTSTSSTTVAQRTSLWIDKDDSGDYDPTQSKKRQTDVCPPKARNNKRKEKELGADRELGGTIKKARPKNTWLSGRNRGYACRVLLKLTSVAGKEKLRQLADAGVPTLDVDDRCNAEDDQPSLWSLGGGSFSQNSRNSLSSAARRRSMFGPDPEGDDDNDNNNEGLDLRTRTLPALDAPRSPRKSASCVPCLDAKRKCTQRKSDIGPSCTQCRKDGIGCFFRHDDQVKKAHKITPRTQCDTPITIESPSSSCLDTKWITTSFVYPINFKFSAAQNPTRTCDFCRDYRYGIVGSGSPKRVEVIVEGNKIIEEMGDGYRAEGKEPSNMCIMCALDRFQICRCAQHEIAPIAGLCPGDFDYPQAFLNFSTPGAPAFNHWCNFCISPAFYACGAPQQYNKFGRPAPPGARRENGCGLLLCPACADALGQSGMDRMKLQEQVRVRGNWRVRADMEFLFHGSDLHKAYYLA